MDRPENQWKSQDTESLSSAYFPKSLAQREEISHPGTPSDWRRGEDPREERFHYLFGGVHGATSSHAAPRQSVGPSDFDPHANVEARLFDPLKEIEWDYSNPAYLRTAALHGSGPDNLLESSLLSSRVIAQGPASTIGSSVSPVSAFPDQSSFGGSLSPAYSDGELSRSNSACGLSYGFQGSCSGRRANRSISPGDSLSLQNRQNYYRDTNFHTISWLNGTLAQDKNRTSFAALDLRTEWPEHSFVPGRHGSFPGHMPSSISMDRYSSLGSLNRQGRIGQSARSETQAYDDSQSNCPSVSSRFEPYPVDSYSSTKNTDQPNSEMRHMGNSNLSLAQSTLNSADLQRLSIQEDSRPYGTSSLQSPAGSPHPSGPRREQGLYHRQGQIRRIHPRPSSERSELCSDSYPGSLVRLARTRNRQKHHREIKDEFLIRGKRRGLSYREIRERGGFTEAESTLRGRYRTITKEKERRVRKPEWLKEDIDLLMQAVMASALDPTLADPSVVSSRANGTPKVAWKAVATFIAENGGSYHFGNATCKKKWDEIMANQLLQNNMD